jgi:16S rRNA (uracil1498-N3)-methyltransferase
MPRPPRFFISPTQITGTSIAITGEDVRHIATVLRMKAGDALLLCDGQGTEFTATIASIDRAEVRAGIVNQTKREIVYPRIMLGQGLPKSDKMDWIVQKATELGAASIVPLITERTIVKVRDEEKRIVRWQRIAREAAMQSDRPDIPKVELVRSFPDFIRSLQSDDDALLILPWEEGTEPVKKVLRRGQGIRKIIVLIGPEGGFSRDEAVAARERGFHIVSLGQNILRTETAAVAVLSMIGYELYLP